MKVAIAALVFMLAFYPIFAWYGDNQAYAYVNVDINPSVQMKVNDDMEVIQINPQNEEAEQILEYLKDWKNKDAAEVTLKMIQLSEKQGFVNDSNQVLIGVSYVHEDEVSVDFSNDIEKFLTEQSLQMSVAAFTIPEKMRKNAEESGVSVNQFFADKIKGGKSGEEESGFITAEDRAIIQSFYKEEPEPAVKEDTSPPTVPAPVKEATGKNHVKDNGPAHKVNDKTEAKGKETAPGQEKKKASNKKDKRTKPEDQSKHPSSNGKGNAENNKKMKKEKPDHKKEKAQGKASDKGKPAHPHKGEKKQKGHSDKGKGSHK